MSEENVVADAEKAIEALKNEVLVGEPVVAEVSFESEVAAEEVVGAPAEAVAAEAAPAGDPTEALVCDSCQ